MSIFRKLRYYDAPLLVASGLLLCIGLAIHYAISLSSGDLSQFWRQLVYSMGFLLVIFLVANYNYQILSKYNKLFYPILLLLLIYLILFGDPIRGSARWIDFGIFQLQPAELAKIVVGIGLSRWLYLNRGQINSLKNIFVTFVYAAIPAGLIFFEPDLGSSLIVMAIWFGLILLSPIKKIYLAGLVVVALMIAGLGWQFVLQDYQRERVAVFLNPDLDPQGKGYNVRQATIAVGSGQLFGRGLGQGVQSSLRFLPEKHTDFVFAAIGEEVGLVGLLVIIGLFVVLLRRLLFIMQKAKDGLARYLSGAVFFLFLTQITINIGMNLGLLPVTGIPLPFLTAGGSTMLVSAIALGVVQNIARQSQSLRF